MAAWDKDPIVGGTVAGAGAAWERDPIVSHGDSQPETSLMQDFGNLAAGAVRGAGSIGATILAPYDMAVDAYKGDRGRNLSSLVTGKELPTRNQERRAQMDQGLQLMGADPDSMLYK